MRVGKVFLCEGLYIDHLHDTQIEISKRQYNHTDEVGPITPPYRHKIH